MGVLNIDSAKKSKDDTLCLIVPDMIEYWLLTDSFLFIRHSLEFLELAHSYGRQNQSSSI